MQVSAYKVEGVTYAVIVCVYSCVVAVVVANGAVIKNWVIRVNCFPTVRCMLPLKRLNVCLGKAKLLNFLLMGFFRESFGYVRVVYEIV